MGYKFDRGNLVSNIRQVPARVQAATGKLVEYHGVRGENAMRKNAPWKDRTTNARNGLHVDVKLGSSQHIMTFAHGVNYGIYLETRFAGKYAIIIPSVRAEGTELMKSMKKLMRRL